MTAALCMLRLGTQTELEEIKRPHTLYHGCLYF